MQIIRDELIIKRDRLAKLDYLERLFEVRTRSRDGKTLSRQIYTLAELQELFSHKEASDRKQSEQHRRHLKGFGPDVPPAIPLNLHWETRHRAEVKEPEKHPDPHTTFEDALLLIVGGNLEHRQE